MSFYNKELILRQGHLCKNDVILVPPVVMGQVETALVVLFMLFFYTSSFENMGQ